MTVNRKRKRYNSAQYGTIDCVMLETWKKLHKCVQESHDLCLSLSHGFNLVIKTMANVTFSGECYLFQW